jgi:hypothetical protein
MEVKESFADDNQKTDNSEGILSTSSETKSSKSMLTDTKSFINYGFNIVVLIALIYMGFKIRGVSKFARIIRKNSRMLKENPAFANVLIYQCSLAVGGMIPVLFPNIAFP